MQVLQKYMSSCTGITYNCDFFQYVFSKCSRVSGHNSLMVCSFLKRLRSCRADPALHFDTKHFLRQIGPFPVAGHIYTMGSLRIVQLFVLHSLTNWCDDLKMGTGSRSLYAFKLTSQFSRLNGAVTLGRPWTMNTVSVLQKLNEISFAFIALVLYTLNLHVPSLLGPRDRETLEHKAMSVRPVEPILEYSVIHPDIQ